MAGRFITVEGGEGVGKTTFLRQFTAALTNQFQLEIVQTFEPGGTPLANQLRALFNSVPKEEKMFIETEFLVVAAARAQHVRHLVQPTLDAGKWVVSDRYTDSSRIYQGLLGGIDQEKIDAVNAFATGGMKPDVTILLDCDVETSLERVGSRASEMNEEKSRFDAKPREYHEKIRRGFLDLAKREQDRFLVVDASGAPEDTLQNALAGLKERGVV